MSANVIRQAFDIVKNELQKMPKQDMQNVITRCQGLLGTYMLLDPVKMEK